MSKKLLIISQRFWPEENDINTVAEYLSQSGIKVDVLCGKPNYPQGRFYEGYRAFGRKKEKYGDINVYRAAELKLMGFIQKRPLVNYFSFGLSSAFRIRSLKKNQYDAVFIWQTSPVFQGRAGLKLAKKRGIRCVMYVHDLWPDAVYKELDIRDPLLKKLFRKISYGQYKKASRLIACCRDAQRFLIKEIAQSPGEVSLIEPFSSAGFTAGVKDDKIMQRFVGSFNLLYAGEVSSDGPFDLFLETAQKIIGTGLRDIRFIIVGAGDGIDDLKKKIDRLFLYDTVFVEGPVSAQKLKGYIYAADALICADKIDASVSYKPPKQIIDSLGAQKPILAATDGEGREIIKKAGCGMVCNPEDPDAFLEIILRLYKTPAAELKRMGENAALYQLRNYNAQTIADEIKDVIFPDD